jgi:hypothetical protein
MPAALAVPLALAGASALSGYLSRKARTPAKRERISKIDPGQKAAKDRALQMALSGLQNPHAGFEPIEQREIKRFNEETIPGLAERFTSMGGGQRSSAFKGATDNAGSNLGGQLAALKANYGFQNRGLLQQLLGHGLSSDFDTVDTNSQATGLSAALQGLSQGLGGLSSGYGSGQFGGGNFGGQQAEGAAETEQGLRSPQEQSFGGFVSQNFPGSGAAPFSKPNRRATVYGRHPDETLPAVRGNGSLLNVFNRTQQGQLNGRSDTFGDTTNGAYNYTPTNAGQSGAQNFQDFLTRYLSGAR